MKDIIVTIIFTVMVVYWLVYVYLIQMHHINTRIENYHVSEED